MSYSSSSENKNEPIGETKNESIVDKNSILIDNKILSEFRFAKRDGIEYDVFSMVHEDPADVDNWMAVKTKHNVMIDPETFRNLKGERIEWVFNEENAIVACKKIYSKQ